MRTTYRFHVVDQTEAVLPVFDCVAVERVECHPLAVHQPVQRLGKQKHRVIHQCCLHLEHGHIKVNYRKQNPFKLIRHRKKCRNCIRENYLLL